MRFAIAALAVLLLAAPVLADDATTSHVFASIDEQYDFEHNPDSVPYKGTFTVTATNSTNEDWGDFHFSLFEIPGFSNTTAIFTDASSGGQDPTISAPYAFDTPTGWAITNGGRQIDLFFYGTPVLQGATVTFVVYTDNTVAPNNPFGVSSWPSPVPEPATMALLGIGLGVMVIRRNKR